jgi:hypothetical protein
VSRRDTSEYMRFRNLKPSERMHTQDHWVPDAMSDRCVEDVLASLPRDDLNDLPFTFQGDDDDG